MDRRNGAEASPIAAPIAREERVGVEAAIAAWRFERFTFDPHRSELCRTDDGQIVYRNASRTITIVYHATYRLSGSCELAGTATPSP